MSSQIRWGHSTSDCKKLQVIQYYSTAQKKHKSIEFKHTHITLTVSFLRQNLQGETLKKAGLKILG